MFQGDRQPAQHFMHRRRANYPHRHGGYLKLSLFQRRKPRRLGPPLLRGPMCGLPRIHSMLRLKGAWLPQALMLACSPLPRTPQQPHPQHAIPHQ